MVFLEIQIVSTRGHYKWRHLPAFQTTRVCRLGWSASCGCVLLERDCVPRPHAQWSKAHLWAATRVVARTLARSS